MSETAQFNPEIAQPTPASEIFISPQERQDLVSASMSEGTINTRLQSGPDEKVDISPSMSIGDSDIDISKLSDMSGYVHGPKEVFEFLDPDAVYEKVGDLVQRRVAETVKEEDDWYLRDPTTAEASQNGNISQMYDLDAGLDSNIKVINFSNSLLSTEQLEVIRQLVEKLAGISGGSLFKGVNAITINPASEFVDTGSDNAQHKKDVIAGTSSGLSKVIRINENVINGNFKDSMNFNGVEVPILDGIVIHELAHLLEFMDELSGKQPYLKSVGWESETVEFTDDYGEHHRKNLHRLRQPTVVVTTESTPANHVYDQQTIQQARPVTKYAGKNGREDFAEAVVSYLHTERDDAQSLDQIRRDAIEGVLQRGAVEHGPFHVQLVQSDRAQKIGTKITPRTFIIAEPKFNYQSEANKEKIKQYDSKKIPDRAGPEKYVTDDYGFRRLV